MELDNVPVLWIFIWTLVQVPFTNVMGAPRTALLIAVFNSEFILTICAPRSPPKMSKRFWKNGINDFFTAIEVILKKL